jgi:hypothetical protein
MIEYILDRDRIGDISNHSQGATASQTTHDTNAKYTFESLRPVERCIQVLFLCFRFDRVGHWIFLASLQPSYPDRATISSGILRIVPLKVL